MINYVHFFNVILLNKFKQFNINCITTIMLKYKHLLIIIIIIIQYLFNNNINYIF